MAKSKDHLFKKGQSGNPKGKPPGPNKITRDMRGMITEALRLAGNDVKADKKWREGAGVAYLRKQAHENPVAFMGLINKLLPNKVDVDVGLTENLLEVLTERREALAAHRAKIIEAQKLEDDA